MKELLGKSPSESFIVLRPGEHLPLVPKLYSPNLLFNKRIVHQINAEVVEQPSNLLCTVQRLLSLFIFLFASRNSP